MSETVVVREVGLRDGLQILSRVLPTADKREWIRRAHAAGLCEIEVGSFVPARLMPQLADTAELVAFANTLPGCRPSVLVPNLEGAERALECGAYAMLLPLSASHAHSLANLKGTPDEVLRLVRAAIDVGVDEVGLADTVGYADPLAVKTLFERARDVAGDKLATAHFHDTRGLGAANVFAAWQAGIRRFDACTGGIGGCPHAPGASGNVATEDVAYLFASMGVPTGLDFAALMALREQVGRWLDGEPLHGAIWRAGLPKTIAAS